MMKWKASCWFGLAIVLLLSGCAGPQKLPRLFWPPPPEQPRLEFIGAYGSEDDFPKTNSQLMAEKVTGKQLTPFFRTPFGVASDGKGTVYVSDIHHRNVRVVDLAKGTVEFFTKDPLFQNPFGLAMDSQGNLYVADGGKGTVLVFGPGRRPLFTFSAAEVMEKPAFLAINESLDRVYVTDGLGHKVAVFNMKGEHLFSFGKKGGSDGEFYSPQGVAIDPTGRVFVADNLNARIQIFDADGKFESKFGTRGDKLWQFDRPKSLAFDSEGHLYVTDSRKPVFLVYDQTGRLLLSAGTAGVSTHKMGFGMPAGIFIDQSDRIFIADSTNKRFSVWQYLSQGYLAKNPVTEKDREELIDFIKRSKDARK